MRRSFFSKAIVAVGVMASAMALSSVAVFAANWVVSNDIVTISQNKSLSIDDEVDTTDGWKTVSDSTVNISKNGYITGCNSDVATGKGVKVAGEGYTNSLRLKGVTNRAIAIKVASACQIDVYAEKKMIPEQLVCLHLLPVIHLKTTELL